MYTANDIRKIQVSLGLLEESEVGADLSKRYTAEDITAIQNRNAQKGREQLRLEGRPPSTIQAPATGTQTEDRTVSGWLSRNASDFMDFIFPNPENETVFNTYNQWLESGTEEQSTRRRNLVGTIGQLDSVVAQDVYAGRQQLIGTMEELADQRLIEQGYTPEEIAEARQMMEYKSELPSWYGILHRPDSSATGIANQAIGGAAATTGAVLQGAEDLVTGTETPAADMTGPARALYQMGAEISAEGDRRLQEARLGLTDGQELAYGLAETVGENLSLGLLSPAALMAEQVARSAGGGVLDMAEQGKSAGTAALSGLGHGAVSYAVERAGIGQMLRNAGMNASMGPVTDKILDLVAKGTSKLPGVVAGTVANAAEEGAEEFIQTYADAAVDQLLGGETPGLLSGELLGQAAQSAAMGFAAGGAIGAASSGIGAAKSARLSARPDEVANQQLSAAIQQAGQSGAAQQMAQSAEQVEAVPAAEPAPEVQEPQAELDQEKQTLLNAYLQSSGGRLEGPIWEALREQPGEDSGAQIETLETPAAPAQTEAEHQDRMAERQGWNEDQQEQAWILENETSMSEAAVNVAVEAMPEDVSRETYLVSANSLYQMARQGVAKTVDEAIRLAEQGGARVGDVLATPGGESALRQIYNQGRLEGLEAESVSPAGLAPAETAGTAEYEPGALVPEEDRALIDLFAAASDTAVTVQEKLENDAGGYIDTALGKVVFGAEAGADTFGTILHESAHWYDSWDREGGRELQNELIRYLAKQRGFENVNSMIEGYIQEYQNAGQELSYAQACEELTADALRGVFDSEESISRWIEKQRQLAARGTEQRSAVDRMMGAVRELLNKIIEKAKSILSTDPGNAAARQAQSLAESQKRALEELYYKHAETAMKAEREARENRSTKELAAEKQNRRYQLKEKAEKKITYPSNGTPYVNSKSYRFVANGESPISEYTGYGMFADNAPMVEMYGEELYTIDHQDLVSIDELKGRIADAWNRGVENYTIPSSLEIYGEDGNAVAERFDPPNIVDGAGAWDDPDLTTWAFDEGVFDDISGVKTKDGAIVWESDIVIKDDKETDVWGLAEENRPRRYQMPVTEIRSERGQRASAWENVDRGAIERELEAAYQSGANQIPIENIKSFAQRLLRTEQSRANQITIAKKLERLSAYLSGGQVDGNAAFAAAEDIAETIMQKSGRMDRELWEQYPDLHYHTVFVRRGGPEYKELLYRYGDYATAQKELAKFGIKVTTGEAHSDSAIDKVYQALSSDYGELFPSDITDAMEQLDRIAQIREMIKPKVQNQYGENWEEAKADLAMRIMGGLVSEGVTDKTMARLLNQRIDEGLNRHRTEIRIRVTKALGDLERSNRLAARKDAQRIVNQAAEGNRRRAEAWAKMNRNQRIALAQSKDALQRARNARSADATRRAIAANLTKLNRMALHPSEKAHIPVAMIQDVLKIAEIANSITRNKNALMDIRALADRINEQAKADNGVDGLADDWKNSGIDEMLHGLVGSIEARARRNARLEQRADAAERRIEQGLDILYSTQQQQADLSEAAQAEGEEIALRLDKLTPEQLNLLRDITSAVLTVVQNQNKLLATQTAQKASEFAAVAKREVENSKKALGQNPTLLQKLSLKYHESVLNAERFFAVLGGYKHGGAMEILAKSLAAGEAKQTAVKEKGVRIFSNVLEGKENQERLRRFAGPDAELVNVGLLGEVKVNHAQAVSLWMHLQHEQNAEHVLKGGVKLPNMGAYAKGDMEEAYRLSEVERFPIDDEQPLADQIQAIRDNVWNALDDYDKMWIADLQELFENYTKNEINKTSRMLSGYDKATVEKYFPLAVDPDALQREIDGLVFNGTIEGRGFLKERKQHAAQPVLLEECGQVAMRSLADTAAYAGMAPAIRDFNKIWNANRDEGGSLKASIRKNFGDGGVRYVEEYISDLQQQPRGRKSIFDGLNGIRGRYAGAVLNLNPKVVLGQISGVFGAGSELGGQATAEAFGYMAKRLAGQYDKAEDARIRQEMMDHGYWGLEAVLTDGPTAEIAELRKRKDRISQITEKLPGAKAMEYMDKLTREGIWVGAKAYVREHLADYNLSDADVDSDAYWAAVVTKATEAITRTQPNYTVSQLAAIQRNPGQLAKIMTMFKTQGFQNYGIVQYAIEDYRTQRQRVEELTRKIERGGFDPENLAKVQASLDLAKTQDVEAGQRLVWAVGSQAVQAVVYSAIAVLAGDLLLHDLDEEKDDDGKITPLSVIRRLGELTIDSAAGSVFLLQEAWSIVGNLFGIRDDDPISLTGIDAFSDLAGDLLQVNKAFTSGEMDAVAMLDNVTDLAGSIGNLVGLPLARVKRLAEGVAGWGKDIATAAQTDGVSLGDVINSPTSSSQYDDLYTAAFENENPADAQEAIEALQKLDKLNPPKKPGDAKAGDAKIISELLKREKEFGTLIQDAAAARVAGNNTRQQKLMQQLVNTLADALGINPKTKDGQRRLTTVINKVNTAISDEVRAQMGADSSTGATIYTPVLNALEAGSGLEEALAVLRRAGIQDSDIRSAVQTAYKEDYLYSDDTGRAAIENKLLSLKDVDGEPYFSEAQMAGWVTDWELKGFNESVYTDLDEALQTRNRMTAQEEIYRYMAAGKSADSIHDRIVTLYRDVYLAAGQAERQELAKFLVGLRGPNGEKLLTVDTLTGWIKDNAKKK